MVSLSDCQRSFQGLLDDNNYKMLAIVPKTKRRQRIRLIIDVIATTRIRKYTYCRLSMMTY